MHPRLRMLRHQSRPRPRPRPRPCPRPRRRPSRHRDARRPRPPRPRRPTSTSTAAATAAAVSPRTTPTGTWGSPCTCTAGTGRCRRRTSSRSPRRVYRWDRPACMRDRTGTLDTADGGGGSHTWIRGEQSAGSGSGRTPRAHAPPPPPPPPPHWPAWLAPAAKHSPRSVKKRLCRPPAATPTITWGASASTRRGVLTWTTREA